MAQSWPEKRVRLVVAFAPGGLIDSSRLGKLIRDRKISAD